MTNPITHPGKAPLTQRDRSKRHPVDLNGYVDADGNELPAHLQDISHTGAAILGEIPDMSNEQFLDLHVEGYDRLQGRIVRRFEGGYALQFDEENKAGITDEELAQFRKLARVRG